MTNKLFDLSGKTALVTGGNKGIGRGMALGLAQAGADIIVVSRSIDADSEIEQEVRKLGRSFHFYKMDAENRDDVYRFLQQLNANHSQIDILINNAGTIMRKPATEHPDEYWDSVISINLDTPFILAREIGKKMIAQGSGKIIFTCSLLSFQGGINVPGYAASKGALASLVKALSNEWSSKGINVNGIAPGYIATDNTEALRQDEERSKSILDRIPSGRWGVPEDFAGPAVFLSSSASNYVDGTILTVDGGWMGR
ncbi:2-deoxy-D-gluconate 3-dehydrogenase [Elizabethkingia meningoseptica]|uniref:SDR family NAD(P)-dependent oxidoreductase n=1 Tax=Elizabethkingia meningoseptica TaxID=238 RepID=UPI000332CB75|nr:SDR family NAD(P)-dependent oxidoreductase [Elizabethkingia meningoseptica]AQX06521.1 2-deoxy-D-gluconate 3-dehydrogenase [Elizabethkingia meningoseptica]AQX48568.1 2-deoxy-D-gluconate 3-dehydrogenase [Elizabethkingia meningoseptica]EOR29576.1 short-chain dehydrogenase/reductase SDR [Elizabethkingia meningoseptica ATCC 13253 = NBRC 12535]KUY13621.1 2-deoxy-D-gluconate 3-dehydrogenase [Elizabethkingia meningoseptica]MDE5488096.1 SDR family NAD(P)-dependent oxidoreductase [Elizabethkingia men